MEISIDRLRLTMRAMEALGVPYNSISDVIDYIKAHNQE